MWKLVSMKVQVEDFGGGKEKGSFLSTHPSFETRANNLGLAMERANHIRAGNQPSPFSFIPKDHTTIRVFGCSLVTTKFET